MRAVLIACLLGASLFGLAACGSSTREPSVRATAIPLTTHRYELTIDASSYYSLALVKQLALQKAAKFALREEHEYFTIEEMNIGRGPEREVVVAPTYSPLYSRRSHNHGWNGGHFGSPYNFPTQVQSRPGSVGGTVIVKLQHSAKNGALKASKYASLVVGK